MNFKMYLICKFNKAISSKFLESLALMLSALFCICATNSSWFEFSVYLVHTTPELESSRSKLEITLQIIPEAKFGHFCLEMTSG